MKNIGYLKVVFFYALNAMAFFSCSEIIQDPILEFNSDSIIVSYDKIDEISVSDMRGYWNNEIANNFIKTDISVYRLVYKSKDEQGMDIELSGAVLVPDMEQAKGLISIQHSTFFHDQEAPSENANFSVVSRKSIFSSNGYIVALPDYLGYGVDKARIHPYHQAATLASASYDMIQATKELVQVLKLDVNDKIYLAGYSEGAFATAALQQLIEEKGEIKVNAISLGSGAYNMKRTFDSFINLEETENTCLPCNAFFVQSYNDYYQLGQPMSYYFQSPYSENIERGLFLGEYDATYINQNLPSNPQELYSPQFLEDYLFQIQSWNNALTENNIHEWYISVPALISHNIDDNVAPYFNSEELVAYNRDNSNVTFLSVPNTNHFDGIFVWGISTMQYFDGQ